MKRFLSALLALSLLSVAPAFASPSDLPAVLTHCGTPDSDTTATSEVDNLPQRTLTYGKVRLEFQQGQGVTSSGWSFQNAWVGHIPMTATSTGNRMPCFRDGLDEARLRDQSALASEDPAIAQQSAPVVPRGAFGIRNFGWILSLVLVIALIAFFIPRRKEMVMGPSVSRRIFRRPKLDAIKARRRPTVLPYVAK